MTGTAGRTTKTKAGSNELLQGLAIFNWMADCEDEAPRCSTADL